MLIDGIITPPPVWDGAVPIEALLTRITITDPKPISVNKAYTVYMGRKRLTTAGKRYKDAIRAQVATASFTWKAGNNAIHDAGGFIELHVTVYLESLFNKSWSPGSMTKPKPNKKTGITPKPKRSNPYQQIDVGNYLKLLEDAIVAGCGIDDASHLDVHLYKRQDTLNPRVEIVHRVMIPA